MSEEKPTLLNQINLVVKSVPESVAFYRRLGLRVEEAGHPEWVEHHATAIMPNGVRLELDSEYFAEQWNRGWKAAAEGAWACCSSPYRLARTSTSCTKP